MDDASTAATDDDTGDPGGTDETGGPSIDSEDTGCACTADRDAGRGTSVLFVVLQVFRPHVEQRWHVVGSRPNSHLRLDTSPSSDTWIIASS